MNRRVRAAPCQFETRAEESGPVIEGYFVRFDDTYRIGPGMCERVAPGAFGAETEGDVRALLNHDPCLVLGRTTAGTLALRETEAGLWGRIAVNPNDSDAMNAYERVKRGDVNQCSFGFDILDEDSERTEDGILWTIKSVKLYEVSVCTFPAYERTQVEARERDAQAMRSAALNLWRQRMTKKVRQEGM